MREKVIGLVSLVIVVAAMWAVPPVQDVGYVLVEYDHPLESSAIRCGGPSLRFSLDWIEHDVGEDDFWKRRMEPGLSREKRRQISEFRRNLEIRTIFPERQSRFSEYQLMEIRSHDHTGEMMPLVLEQSLENFRERSRQNLADWLNHITKRIGEFEQELIELMEQPDFEGKVQRIEITRRNIAELRKSSAQVTETPENSCLDHLDIALLHVPKEFLPRTLSGDDYWKTWGFEKPHVEVFQHFFRRGALD